MRHADSADRETRTPQLDAWTGDFGNDYTHRNLPGAHEIEARTKLWREIFTAIASHNLAVPHTMLEVGANVGQNLMALRKVSETLQLVAVEPNGRARSALIEAGFTAHGGCAQDLPWPDETFDLVFTSGVLVHVNPNPTNPGEVGDLHKACREIVRVSKQWVVAIEYFSAEPREVFYRHRANMLWTRDFGQFYAQNCGLLPVACGFAWKPITGLDNVTWWVLRKP